MKAEHIERMLFLLIFVVDVVVSLPLLPCYIDLFCIEISTALQDRIESSRVGSFIYFRFDGIFNSTSNKPNGLARSILHLLQSQSQNSYIHNPLICCESTESEWKKEESFVVALRFVWTLFE